MQRKTPFVTHAEFQEFRDISQLKIEQRMSEIGFDITETILSGMQRMFDEQNRRINRIELEIKKINTKLDDFKYKLTIHDHTLERHELLMSKIETSPKI